MKLLRDPFAQFLACGALIFLVFQFTAGDKPADLAREIDVDAPTQEWIYGNFSKQFRRPPSRTEMDTLVEVYIRNEVKYREALALGLDAGDSIVRRRLMQKFDFLFGNGAADTDPEDATLQAWYDEHSDRFAIPARLTFTHLWFSPDSRGAATWENATAAMEALQAGTRVEGDNFPFDDSYTNANHPSVRSVFGEEFADAIFEAPLATWTGPLRSGLGYHVVRITERSDAIIPPLQDIRQLILDEWRRAESEDILARGVAELMADYVVIVDEDSLEELTYTSPGQESMR